ncbi:MAG: hypothetical protein IPI11_05240 [Haliscomenobacter sp.]|nr:hypothetical protein [Haliscomenobacter sp.]
MTTQQFIQNIRDLIAKDDLTTAIAGLKELLDHTPRLNEVLQQSGRFENIQKQIRLGTVSHSEANLTQNQIRLGLLDLVSEMEQQDKTATMRAEIERAISIVNSKNVVIGSTISAGGNVHVGDAIAQNFHPESTHSFNMANQRKAIWLTVLITILGVIIGFLGELMPDAVKKEIEAFVSSSGISFKTAWYSITGFIVLLFTGLVWKEASKDSPSPEQRQGTTGRNVHQQGDKSIYIEKNDGPINIQ